PVLDSIRELLRREGADFREVHHEATRTSEESARARGEDWRVGGKGFLLKGGRDFRLFVFSATGRFETGPVRAPFGVKKLRFATPEELSGLTGLVPGSVPPFGRPILPFELFVDDSILLSERIAFNAGSLTDSIIMATKDYRRIAVPTVF